MYRIQSKSGVTLKQLHSITVKFAVHPLCMSDFHSLVRINMLCSVTFMIQVFSRNRTGGAKWGWQQRHRGMVWIPGQRH